MHIAVASPCGPIVEKCVLKCPLGWQNTLYCPLGWLKHDKLPSWEPKCALKCPLQWWELFFFSPLPSKKSVHSTLLVVICSCVLHFRTIIALSWESLFTTEKKWSAGKRPKDRNDNWFLLLPHETRLKLLLTSPKTGSIRRAAHQDPAPSTQTPQIVITR